MTNLDLALAGLILLGGLWGAWQGAIRQIGNFVAGGASYAAPWAFAGPLAHWLQRSFATPSYTAVYCICVVGLALIAQAVVRLIFSAIRRAWLKRPPRSGRKEDAKAEAAASTRLAADRVVGGLTGTAETMLGIWLALSLLVLIATTLEQRGMRLDIRSSTAFELSRRYNAIAYFFGTDIHRIDKALREVEEPVQRDRKRSDAAVVLGHDPRVVAMLRDSTLRKDLAGGDFTALARSPDLLSFITDADAMKNAAEVFVADLGSSSNGP